VLGRTGPVVVESYNIFARPIFDEGGEEGC
jgi:hypothetical protein